MLEIGKQVDMEVSIIKYVIDGVQDDEHNKILYGAKTICELKEKFEFYEAMKENLRAKSKKTEEKTKEVICGAAVQENMRRCFLCGDRSYMSASCPTKNKGVKCFKCQEYRHVASECKGVNKLMKRLKKVQIEHCKLVALVDSGSDLNLMRAEHYIKIGAPRLDNKILQFRGVRTERSYTLGEFPTYITIHHTTYPINIHVVPDTLTNHSLILGTNFLDSVELVMKGGEIFIAKLDVPEVFNINVEAAVDEVDLSHVIDPEHKRTVENFVEGCKSNKTREVGIMMNIVLTDIPVYQRPR